MNAFLNPLLVLLAILVAAATTPGLAAPLQLVDSSSSHLTSNNNLRHLQHLAPGASRSPRHVHLLDARQTDNYRQAVAGPVGAAELAWVFGALFATWALIVIGILILRKRRNEELEDDEDDSMQDQDADGKEWADT